MQWIAPSEKDDTKELLEMNLWDATDHFHANSGLKSQEYSSPVLGLHFLRFAEDRFRAKRARLEKTAVSSRRGSRVDEPATATNSARSILSDHRTEFQSHQQAASANPQPPPDAQPVVAAPAVGAGQPQGELIHDSPHSAH